VVPGVSPETGVGFAVPAGEKVRQVAGAVSLLAWLGTIGTGAYAVASLGGFTGFIVFLISNPIGWATLGLAATGISFGIVYFLCSSLTGKKFASEKPKQSPPKAKSESVTEHESKGKKDSESGLESDQKHEVESELDPVQQTEPKQELELPPLEPKFDSKSEPVSEEKRDPNFLQIKKKPEPVRESEAEPEQRKIEKLAPNQSSSHQGGNNFLLPSGMIDGNLLNFPCMADLKNATAIECDGLTFTTPRPLRGKSWKQSGDLIGEIFATDPDRPTIIEQVEKSCFIQATQDTVKCGWYLIRIHSKPIPVYLCGFIFQNKVQSKNQSIPQTPATHFCPVIAIPYGEDVIFAAAKVQNNKDIEVAGKWTHAYAHNLSSCRGSLKVRITAMANK
jgi:hypothetical protein